MTDAAFSFNEVESLSAKAARGAGLGWGHAEDLGRAARWLAERGLDWSRPLLRLLDAADAAEQATALARAADHAARAKVGDSWRTKDTTPALLAPMLSAALHGRGANLVLRSDRATMVLHPDGSARLCGAADTLDGDGPVAMAAVPLEPGSPDVLVLAARPAPLPAVLLARLSAYADRTAVPASAASRTRGAGSTLSDND